MPISAPTLSDSPAAEAWTVVPTYPDGQRLCLIKRGHKRTWLPITSTAGMTFADLERIANEWNEEAGVSRDAAGALKLDWTVMFKIPPTDPVTYFEYHAGEERLLALRKGFKSGRRLTASPGWLSIVVGTHGQPVNEPIYPGSIRHTWLTAHYEVIDWAQVNGRKSPRSLLPTERAALRVTEAASALSRAADDYHGYSRKLAQLLLSQRTSGAQASYDHIRSLDQTERRALLLKLRADRRPLLRAFFKAAEKYAAARASLRANGQVQ